MAIKFWTENVPVEAEAKKQIENISNLPFIHKWIAVMPDVHLGKGAAVGTVIPTTNAIIPSAVGVDIGCGMVAVETSLDAKDLPDSLKDLRIEIEKAIPHGKTFGKTDQGTWKKIPKPILESFSPLVAGYKALCDQYPKLKQGNDVNQLGTLGTGNHFIEVCVDERNKIWLMLHSGSRGVGNRMGTFFIELAKKDMGIHLKNLPDENLAYLKEGTVYFDDYVKAVGWAQDFAFLNRQVMLKTLIEVMKTYPKLPKFEIVNEAINCHHNYVQKEFHFGKEIYVTRKGAVRAGFNELGIIPGSMGAKSFIVRGKGNANSFSSCSHGAGRRMSRGEAMRTFTVADHIEATRGVECRKDKKVIDETPGAYKDIDQVMAAQKDLVDVVHTLKQILVVKG